MLMLIACVRVVPGQEAPKLVWPPPPQQARIEFVSSIHGPSDIGVKRSFLGKMWDWIVGADRAQMGLIKPLGVAVDLHGRLYVTDPGARCVHVFDANEKEYTVLTDAGDDQALQSPVGVVVGADGKVYVTDSGLRKVVVYSEGDVVSTIEGLFERPTGIAIKGERLYVVDTGLNKVFVFDDNGKLVLEFGRRGVELGEFNYPVFIAASDKLYLADAMNFRVQVLDDTGRASRAFGEVGNVQGTFAGLKGIAVDEEGHIYAADALFDAFQIFDNNGRLLLVVGNTGTKDGEFRMPAGICTDRNDNVYVVDVMNRRVQMFKYLGNRK